MKTPKFTKSHYHQRKIVVLILLLFSYLQIMAVNPGKIDGSVTDAETFKAVPFANVELLKSPDSTLVKATITDNDGKYHFEDVAFGKYIIRVSYMGYRKQVVSDFEITPQKSVIKFGPTSLETESKKLDEVTVIGYKLTGQIEDDKTIYTIPAKSAEIAPSGVELLRQLPDVTVDFMSNDVKLAGSSNILFQVDGRKVDKNYLTQLNPSLVEKIEVITNPGAKYDSDVDAVINIILKKNMKYGLGGRLRLDVPTSSVILSRSNASVDLFFKKVRVYAAGNLSVRRFEIEQTTERINTPEGDNISTLTQNGSGVSRNVRGGFSYGVDWFLNDNNTFNFFSSVQPNIPNKNTFTSENTYVSDVSDYQTRNTNESTDNSKFYDYSVFYKHKFKKKQHEISFESYLSNRNADNARLSYDQNYLNGSLNDALMNVIDQSTDDNNRQLSLKSDYTYPFTDQFKLSAGYNGNFTSSDYTYREKTSDFSDRTDYKENRQIGYTNLSWSKGNLNLQAGLRFENSDIHINHNYDTTNRYSCLLPSVSAQYKLGKKQTFRLNYRRSVQRPGVSQLSPVNYTDDPYLQSIGNPGLKPAYYDRFELTHRIQLKGPMYISYRPYIRFNSDGIRQVYLPVNGNDSVSVRKYSNVSNELEYGATVSGTVAFVKWWTISPTYTYYFRNLKALPAYGINEDQKLSAWRLNISSQFILPKQWVVFVEYGYSSPYISLQSTSRQNYEFVTGFYKAVTKKFNITAFTLNPWSHRYVFDKSTTTTNNSVRNSEGVVKYPYLFVVRLGFNFNYGKEGKKLNRQRDTEEDTDTKKGIF